jgi:hypothetical protein
MFAETSAAPISPPWASGRWNQSMSYQAGWKSDASIAMKPAKRSPAYGAAGEERPVKPEAIGHRQHRRDVELGREQVFLGLEALRWQALAMPRHVEGDQPVVPRHLRVVH